MPGENRPVLIIVNGHPATGKTTLAIMISEELSIPLFAKDAIKERLFETVGATDREASRTLGRAAFSLLRQSSENLLGSGKSLIIEANFDQTHFGPWVTDIEQRLSPLTVQVFLRADPDTIMCRFKARANSGRRHSAHMDDLASEELRERLGQPPRPLDVNGPTLTVDTTDFERVDSARIIEWLTKISGLSQE